MTKHTPAATVHIADRSVPRTPDVDLDPARLEFGRMFSPNMFVATYADGEWREPAIEPLRPLSLHPGAVGLHYGQSIFEGLKAFLHRNGRIVLFRPDANARRLNRSARILDMPALPEDLFVEAARRLVAVDRAFVPRAPGSLYIRPAMFATEPCLGVRSASEYVFFIVTLPTGSYFKETSGGAGAVRVLVSDSAVRAVPGGTGAAKAAGNYAATLRITSHAKTMGCSQVLFLNGLDRRTIEEMGGMNIFFVRRGTLVTPPLTDTILEGTMRDTLMVCAAELGVPTAEEALDIDTVLQEIRSGVITEAIACGTAAALTGISGFRRESGEEVTFAAGAPGPVTNRLYDHVQGIQRGERPDTHGWLLDV